MAIQSISLCSHRLSGVSSVRAFLDGAIMPYIEQSNREQYDGLVDQLFEGLKDKPIGHVNYVISRLIWKLFHYTRSYTVGNNLVGALYCAALEYKRRKLGNRLFKMLRKIAERFYSNAVVPYEDEKIKENGDVVI